MRAQDIDCVLLRNLLKKLFSLGIACFSAIFQLRYHSTGNLTVSNVMSISESKTPGSSYLEPMFPKCCHSKVTFQHGNQTKNLTRNFLKYRPQFCALSHEFFFVQKRLASSWGICDVMYLIQLSGAVFGDFFCEITRLTTNGSSLSIGALCIFHSFCSPVETTKGQ